MIKIIRLTEEQLKEIEESTFDNGIDTPSEIPEYPQYQVTVSGKENDEEFADPVITGDVASKMCKQLPWGSGSYYRGMVRPTVFEESDMTGDGVPDMFNHADANELTDGDESDDQQIIPHSVEMHLDNLIKAVKDASLPAKKQINLLNKFIDSLDLKGILPSYKKEAAMKINSKR